MSDAGVTAPATGAMLAAWLAYWTQVHVTAIDLGLDRVRPVAEHLGILTPNAHVVTVAGTNGKGSTTTTIASIYTAAGYRVGLYQSPHIISFNERVRLNGIPVADERLIAAFERVEAARVACGLTLSFFEATTLAAFVIFAEQACEIWVLEVGLGGRLDVVNLIDPDVAVITNIGLDHTEWLGDTIEKIAFEKAGILRPQIPVVYADPTQYPQAIADHAAKLGCTVTRAGVDYLVESDATHLYYSAPACTLRLPRPSLAVVNVAAAISAVLLGAPTVDQHAISTGIQTAQIAGRFEQRMWRARQLILDVAHNVHGMQFLREQLVVWRQQQTQQGQLHLVFSMLADKDIAGVVTEISGMVDHWHIAPMHVPRAAGLDVLQNVLSNCSYQAYADLPQALAAAVQHTTPHDLIVVCGSFHVLEAVWEVLADDGSKS